MAADSSHRPASRKRNRETTKAASNEFWGADFVWRGSTLAGSTQESCQLCSSCQSLLIRSGCDPSTQNGALMTDPGLVIRQSLSETSVGATNGCIICKLVIAAKTIISHDATKIDRLDGFQLAFYWFDKSCAFDRIDVGPVDHMNNYIPVLEGGLNIKLVLEDEHRGCEDKAITYQSPLRTGSELGRSIATRWLINCISGHPKCREHQSHVGWLPTRLIDVGLPGNSQPPQLILTSGLKIGSTNGYVTLSHRWASTRVVKLESSNIDSFRQHIPLESLSSTFVDAIRVTQALGVRYLWIDSLCIIQDSLADWQAESTQMGNVYANCICNIAATGSSDDGGGLFQERNTHWVTPNRVRIQYQGHDKIYSASLEDPWGRWISKSTLNRRGWVLQERLLSPRTLHFASQLFWECRMHQACETYPEGMPLSSENLYTNVYGDQLPMSLKNWREDCEASELWTNVVQTYATCSITMPSDRLIAIAGVAKSLQAVLNDQYLAGLWRKDLPYNLVWSVYNSDGQSKLSEIYRCPSWSWAALDYSSALMNNLLVDTNCRVDALVTVADVCIEPLGSDEFGPLQGGYLRLTGRIGRIISLAANIDPFEGEWIDGHLSYEMNVDHGLESLDDESLYCLPLLVRRENPGPEHWPRITDCLLLKLLKPGALEFTRLGLFKVSLDLEDTLPQEIRWIAEHANSEPGSRHLIPVTIY